MELCKCISLHYQVASTTLDASAKIYAGRVDAIHTETYKVLSGLGRGRNDKNKANEGIINMMHMYNVQCGLTLFWQLDWIFHTVNIISYWLSTSQLKNI